MHVLTGLGSDVLLPRTIVRKSSFPTAWALAQASKQCSKLFPPRPVRVSRVNMYNGFRFDKKRDRNQITKDVISWAPRKTHEQGAGCAVKRAEEETK